MITSWLAFSCPHCPLQDDEAVEWLLEQIKEHRPDTIVHLGDGHEADAASKFQNEYDFTLRDEYEAHNNFLSQVRKASPSSRRVFLPGNHDNNLLKWARLDKDIRDLCDYHEWEPELKHWEEPCQYINGPRGVFRIGQVSFFHGYQAGASADAMQSVRLGLPYGLTVSGHTHSPVDVTQDKRSVSVLNPFWYANAGTLRDIDNVPWMDDKDRQRWGQAVVVGESETWRYEQSLMPQKPLWEAKTIVRRMY